MQMVLPFLFGVLLGIGVSWWVSTFAHRNALREYHDGDRYEPARRAVARHIRLHGTLTAAQFERMTEIEQPTAASYLDRMEREGFLRRQGHRGGGIFYTLT